MKKILNLIDENNLEEMKKLDLSDFTLNQLDSIDTPPLFYAIEKGNFEIVKLLLLCGANPNIQFNGQIPLNIAIRNGEHSIITELLDFHANILESDSNGVTPLHEAAFIGDVLTAEQLIAKGAYIHAKANNKNTPIDLAEKNGHSEMIKLLNEKKMILTLRKLGS